MRRRFVKGAYDALMSQRKRSLLATLGVVVGVASLVLMISVGEGAKRKVLKEFESMGRNLILISAGKVSIRGGRVIQHEAATTLKQRDVRALLAKVPGIVTLAPVYDHAEVVKAPKATVRTRIAGTTPEYTRIKNFYPSEGRFFTREEVTGRVRVAVLGAEVAKRLFPGQNPVGETLRIRRVPFKVIGVMEAKGVDASGENQDNQILIPVTTATSRLFHVTYINSIVVEAESEEAIPQVISRCRHLLRMLHSLGKRGDDFSITSMEEIMREKEKTANIFAILVAAVASVSLLVGIVGVLAVMLLSVGERIQEIGIRRAVGARRTDITLQFLTETVVLSAMGGTMGVAIGIALSMVATLIGHWEMVVPWKGALLGMVASLVAGMAAGIYPAYRASKINPIEALRI